MPEGLLLIAVYSSRVVQKPEPERWVVRGGNGDLGATCGFEDQVIPGRYSGKGSGSRWSGCAIPGGPLQPPSAWNVPDLHFIQRRLFTAIPPPSR